MTIKQTLHHKKLWKPGTVRLSNKDFQANICNQKEKEIQQSKVQKRKQHDRGDDVRAGKEGMRSYRYPEGEPSK